MKTLSATWNAYTDFVIPDDVYEYLLPEPYGADLEAVGRWYIRWNTFYYNDKEGREQQIEGKEPEVDCKLPTCIENEDEVIYKR